MTGFNDHKNLVGHTLEIIVEDNSEDGELKPLWQWYDASILHLDELLRAEIKRWWPHSIELSPATL